jgi:hypothetical protein
MFLAGFYKELLEVFLGHPFSPRTVPRPENHEKDPGGTNKNNHHASFYDTPSHQPLNKAAHDEKVEDAVDSRREILSHNSSQGTSH